MIIFHIWDELRAVQKPTSDIWRVVPTAAILQCYVYLQHKIFLAVSIVKFQVCISQAQLTPTKGTPQTKNTEVGTYSTLCWEAQNKKLEPQYLLAQGLQIQSILLSSKTTVDSLPCLTPNWAATISHHLPHWIPPSRATSPDISR